MVGNVYLPGEKEGYNEHFTAWWNYLQEKGYKDMNHQEKRELLQSLDLSESESLTAARSGFRNLKQQTIAYYLSTEEVGTKFLNYLPVPGEYDGCIALDDVGGKAWAL